jgi:hypothetical protein
MQTQQRWKDLVLNVLVVLATVSGLLACSSFDLTNSWRSPEFAGPAMRKVLVIGVSQSDATRRIFEDGFAQALSSAGVAATSSYGALPEKGQISNERLKVAVAQSKADSVMITRLLRVDQRADVVQPAPPVGGYYRGGFYGWYGTAWASAPVSVSTYNVLTIETSLWDMRNETMIWSGVTETIQPSDIAKATGEMAKVLIEKMKKDGVI